MTHPAHWSCLLCRSVQHVAVSLAGACLPLVAEEPQTPVFVHSFKAVGHHHIPIVGSIRPNMRCLSSATRHAVAGKSPQRNASRSLVLHPSTHGVSHWPQVVAQATRSRIQPVAAPSDRRAVYQELLQALGAQFQKETLPWLSELVAPLTAGPPAPLTDTLSPEELADIDSQFTWVNGVSIHFKEYVGRQLGPSAESDTGSGDDFVRQDSSSWGRPAAASTEGAISTAYGVGAATSDFVDPENGPGMILEGPAPGAPPSLLMLHGFNGSEFNWRLVAQPIADVITAVTAESADGDGNGDGSGYGAGEGQVGQQACRAVAYDRPPFGLSGRPTTWQGSPETDPYSLSGGLEIAAGMIRQLGLGPVIVMGHSAGAPVALELAIKYPDLVQGVVLVAPAISTNSKGALASADLGRLLRFAYTRWLLSNDDLGLQYVRQQIRKREAEVRKGKFGVYEDDSKFLSDEVIEGFLRPLRAHDWDKASLALFRQFSLGPSNTDWQAVKAPVLVVQGDKDTTIPAEMAKALVKKLQSAGCRCDYQELSQCGHLPMEEKPTEFIDSVSRFIARRCLGASSSDYDTASAYQMAAQSDGGNGQDSGTQMTSGVSSLGSMQDAVDPVRRRQQQQQGGHNS